MGFALFATQCDLMEVLKMKNVSMLGGALLITYFGSGPLSIKE